MGLALGEDEMEPVQAATAPSEGSASDRRSPPAQPPEQASVKRAKNLRGGASWRNPPGRAEADGACDLRLRRWAAAGVVGGEQAPCVHEEALSGLGQPDRSRRAFEQAGIEGALEAGNPKRNRRMAWPAEPKCGPR
jgi:hypothetical protein